MNARVKYYDPIVAKKFGKKVRIVALSDTHTFHHQVKVPECDVLCFAGDFSSAGRPGEVLSFLNWLNAQPASYKLYCAGNHDESYEQDLQFKHMVLNQYPDLIYLEDTGVKIFGLTFWGSPFTPEFCNWSFMLPRGKPLQDKWAMVPDETNVLITHGPPYGIMDDVSFIGTRVGDVDLRNRVKELKDLRAHFFGHIHREKSAKRQMRMGKTTFANVSLCNDAYSVVNEPIVLDL